MITEVNEAVIENEEDKWKQSNLKN
jgi:hypothetical protein